MRIKKSWSCQILRIKKSWSCENLRIKKSWSCQVLRIKKPRSCKICQTFVVCVPVDHPLWRSSASKPTQVLACAAQGAFLCSKTHTSACLCSTGCFPVQQNPHKCLPVQHRVLSCAAKPMLRILMKWIDFDEIWGSEFQTAKCGKISIEVTPASVWAILLDSLETIQVGPLTPQNCRFCLSGASRAIVSQTRIFNPERITHIPCLKMRVSKTWLACFWQCQFGVRIPIPSGTGSQKLKIECFIFSVILMCLIWYRDSYGFLHMAFLQFWKSKLASFLWHILSCVHCHELSCFAKQNPLYRNPLLCASVPKMKSEGLGLVKWNPWNRKIDLGHSRFSTEISKFWYHDGVMMMVPWSQNLKCPKSDHVKFWESRNLDHVKIWEHQKSDHVKNWDVPKIWSCQNLRIPKIWSCQKWESKIPKKKTDVDVIMKTWNIFSCCVCFHQGFLMDFWTFIKVCFYIFMFFRWWCYHVLVVMISKHGIPKIWWCQKLTILQIGSWQLFWVLQKSGSSQNDLIMMMVSWSHHDDGVMTATASSESQSLDFCNPLSTDLTIFFLCVPVDHPLCLQTDPKMASFFVLIGKSREYTHSASVEQS